MTHKCSSCGVAKESVAFSRRLDVKSGLTSQCKSCMRLSYQRRRETILSQKRIYYAKNSPALRTAHKRWYGANKLKQAARMLVWQRANRDKLSGYAAARRAAKNGAVPAWANRFFISEIYALARLRTRLLGQRYEVDHIVPLVSPIVCGLHVENNLRIVPIRTNRSKGNWHWPDMPEKK